MALTVEDGTGLAAADSYISLADARTWAANYGYTLPADDTEAEVALRKAAQYVDLQPFKGSRTTSAQALEWPRTGVYCDGNLISYDTIPEQVKQAQTIAAATYGAGVDVRPETYGRQTKREKLDVMELEYFQGGSDSVTITEANDRLRCLVARSGVYNFGVCRG